MVKKLLKSGRNTVRNFYYFLRCTCIRWFFLKKLIKEKGKLHIGCGDVKLNGFINIDFRPTKAADISHDCVNLSIIPRRSISLVYANAFFEHVYRLRRVDCLLSIHRILRDEGIVVFLAIPDFPSVAKAYLEKKRGIVGKRFDLFNVYRYTHGDPEQYPTWWLSQLHKSLFDKEEIERLLLESGFSHWTIFSYIYKDDKLDVLLGFVAGKKKDAIPHTKKDLLMVLSSLTKDVNEKSVRIVSMI